MKLSIWAFMRVDRERTAFMRVESEMTTRTVEGSIPVIMTEMITRMVMHGIVRIVEFLRVRGFCRMTVNIGREAV
jgi:hypothetical protein